MAITVDGQPQGVSFAYNENYWYFNSTNKANLGHRYLAKVKVAGDVVGTYSLRPIPTSLRGEVDVSTLLQTTLKPDFQQVAKFYNPTKQYKSYVIDVDEEFFQTVAFTSYAQATSGNWAGWSGIDKTRLTHSAEPPFIVGDIINIKQTSGLFRPELEGIHTVIDVLEISGVWNTILSLNWIGTASSSSSGTTTYADGKKTIVTGITTGGKVIFAGALPFSKFKTYNRNDYEISDGAMSTLPEAVRISRTKPTYFLGIFADPSPSVVFDIDGTLYRYATTVMTATMFNILPSTANIEQVFSDGVWVAFTGTIDLSNVKKYTFRIYEDDDPASKIYTVNLYSECDKYETVDVCFFDRLGSWITIPFNKALYINSEVERATMRQKYGGLVGSAWTYDLTDAGETIYDISENITFTINSGQLNEIESQFMRELLSNPQAYVSINGGEFQAIIIQNTSLSLPKARTTKQRNVSLDFKFAVQDSING